MRTSGHHRLKLDDDAIEWRLTRSQRRTLAVHVNNGQVEVRSPDHLNLTTITDFVTEKAPWIKARLALQARQRDEVWRLQPGASVPYLGKPYTVFWQADRAAAVRIDGERLDITGPDLDLAKATRIFGDWLRKAAQSYIPPRVHNYANVIGHLHRIAAIRFRRTRTKWGHCTASGTLQFNWLVMLAPAEVVDYLIAHEVSHLKYLNHSPAFWAQVAQLCPDYRRRRQWLRDNQHRFTTFDELGRPSVP